MSFRGVFMAAMALVACAQVQGITGTLGFDRDEQVEGLQEMEEEYIVADTSNTETPPESSGDSSAYESSVGSRDPTASNPYSETTPQRAAGFSSLSLTGTNQEVETYYTNEGLVRYTELYPGDRSSPQSDSLEPPPPPPPPTMSVSSPADFAEWANIDEDDLDDGDVFVILSTTGELDQDDTDDQRIDFARSFLQI